MQQTKRVDKLAVNWLFWMIKGPTKYAGKSSRVKFGLAPPTELKKENGAGFMENNYHTQIGEKKSQPKKSTKWWTQGKLPRHVCELGVGRSPFGGVHAFPLPIFGDEGLLRYEIGLGQERDQH